MITSEIRTKSFPDTIINTRHLKGTSDDIVKNSLSETLAKIKALSSLDLLSRSKELASQERQLGVEFLYHLYEVERRKLYLELKYSSLIEFVINECKYSSGSAYRRVEAMRLLTRVPDLKEDLLSGDLNLTLVSKAAQFIRQEKASNNNLTHQEQSKVLNELKGKSTREAEVILAGKATEPAKIPGDRERVLTESLTEIKFVITKELKEKLNRLKDYLSHKNPKMSYAKLLEIMADQTLKEFEKGFRKTVPQGSSYPDSSKNLSSSQLSARQSSPRQHLPNQDSPNPTSQERAPINHNNKKLNCPSSSPALGKGRNRFIPIAIKREIWERDQGRCTFVSPLNGQRCDATRFIEFEHKMPWALGGEQTAENLTLRCRNHNTYMATKLFGEKKIRAYGAP